MISKMFCYQCQETAGGKGCTASGVCGKKTDVAAAQDQLIHATKEISVVTTRLRAEKKTIDVEINRLITLNLFMTITNANFALEALKKRIEETHQKKTELDDKFNLPEKFVGVLATENEDIRSLRELITYGLKGLCAYHSRRKSM